MVRLGLSFLLMCMCVLPAFAQNQSLTAFVDRTDISIEDVFTLTIRIDAGMGNSRPSFAGLNREFEQVGGISSRSTYTNNNGNIQSWTEYSIMLRPLTTGTLTIPAFRVNAQVTTPIQINVGDARQNTSGDNNEIFLRTTASKETVYVQEQLLYTIKIYWSISFDQGAQLTSPQVADAVVQQLGSDDNYQEVVNGISYNVTERRFVIFPQSSGELVIPPVYFSASVGRRGGINRLFSNRTNVREINLISETQNIEVKPQPASFPGSTWLPASNLALTETWSGSFDNLTVGDAITRNVTINAEGLSSSLLQGVEYADLDGLRFYPDQPVREDSADREGVSGKRSEGTAMVASKAGEFLLPEVRLPWWNTKTDRLETAVLPARTIVVLPSTASDTRPGVLTDNNGNQSLAGQITATSPGAPASGLTLFWISTTAVFATAWAFTTFLWLRSRRQLIYVETVGMPQPTRMPDQLGSKSGSTAALPDADASLRVLKTACESGNLADIRKALLKWGQGSFGTTAVQTLQELGVRCRQETLTTLFNALDANLYGGAAEKVDCKALYSAVAALHKTGVTHTQQQGKYALPPLYKQ